jgi:hypothetical protein
MPSTSTGKFSCDGCGKSYSWKAELAGRRVKCKCGGVMTVPKADPAAAAAEEALPPEFEDLYALAEGPVVEAVTPPAFTRGGGTPCPSCGVNVESGAAICVACGAKIKTGKKGKTKATGGGGGGGGTAVPALATAGGRGGGAMLGYAQMAPKRHGSDEERSGDVFFNPLRDLYIPGALIVGGTIISYIAIVFRDGVRSPGIAVLAVGLMTLFSLILTVPAVLLSVKLFDLGLGPIGPGILKIAACAIAPGAVGDLMSMIFHGAAGGYIGWCMSYLITLGIFMKLLDMDFGEVLMCSTFIFLLRTWAVTALLMLVMRGFGMGGLPIGGGFGGGGGSGAGRITLAGDVDHDEDDSLDAIRARESDEMTIRTLHGGGVDGKTWIEGGSNRVLAGQDHGTSLQIIRDFFSAGATEVRVFPHKDAKRNQETALTMIVIPPDDKDTRARVFKQMKPLAKLLGRVTSRDRGEKYWPIEMLAGEDLKGTGLGDDEFDPGIGAKSPVPGKSDDGDDM